MKPETHLDSAVFQLTPTRTRCDLVITANGKTEKIASGLLNPFLAHLKAAQDQISKGGYSITLEPSARAEYAPWFTKGTVERFVRFVSTPEVLERVSTIESEMLQIGEAITVQGNESLGSSTVENHHQTARPPKSTEGSKATLDADAEKAIILYKPGSHPNPSDSAGSTTQEENSKVQLLRVLETRKSVLQKEQGMAFARAAAAGFDMDHMTHLISFAECFGASRLMKACASYMELWKTKHETGQWVEVDAAEAMSFPSEFASLNVSGIVLSGEEAGNNNNGELNSDHNKDQRHPAATQVPMGPHEYFKGQYPHPTYPQWPIHGQPMYQPYPMQGMPYYQNYPGNGPFFQPPYSPMEDPRFSNPQKTRRKRQSMDSKDVESDPSESSTISPNDADQNGSEFEKEASEVRESRKKHGRSRKKQSGMVVIRNLNYISKRAESSGSDAGSASNSETEEETESMLSRILEGKHKKHSGSSKKKDSHRKSTETSNTYAEDDVVTRREEDSGNWNAFQSSLLRAEEKTSTVTGDMFAGEKDTPVKRRYSQSKDDHIVLHERDSDHVQELRIADFDSVNTKARVSQTASDDVLLNSSEGRDSQQDFRFQEIEGGGRGYRKVSDDFIIYGQEQQMGGNNSAHPIAEYESIRAAKSDQHLYNASDESYMIPFRSGTQDHLGADNRATIDMDSEYPALKCPQKDSNIAINQPIYEPDDLTLMPDRDVENGSYGYDPARDYDYEVPIDVSANPEIQNQEEIPASVEEVPTKSDTGKNSKVVRKGLAKRREPIMRKGPTSKSSTLVEAQKRAEKLRAYKADLQKEKKEKEEEGLKRLEALKREREKRIAARSNSGSAQSPLTPKQNRASLPAKISPSSYKGLKINDPEPGSSSPLPKLSTRTSSISSVESQKIATTSRADGSTNGLSRSVSSLPELKKEAIHSESKADLSRIKRLAEPKGSNINHATSVKPKNMPKDPQTKISAITQLDKTKSATLPELKVKTSKAPSAAQKSASKESSKVAGSKNSATAESMQARKSDEKFPQFSNVDDNRVLDPVVEKTVVMLESGNALAPIVQASNGIIHTEDKSHRDDGRDRTGPASEYVAIRAPPSPIVAEVGESELNVQLNSSEVVISKDEPQKSLDSTVVEKPYQAPYARASSLEGPVARNLEYSQPPPPLSSEVATPVVESNFRADVPSSVDLDSVEQNQEMNGKSRGKQSGFRKLLKFARKSNSPASGEGNEDSDGPVVDDNEASASSNDVHLLKNLISQDDGHASKVSRPFSLLSPFRKASEKKLQYA